MLVDVFRLFFASSILRPLLPNAKKITNSRPKQSSMSDDLFFKITIRGDKYHHSRKCHGFFCHDSGSFVI